MLTMRTDRQKKHNRNKMMGKAHIAFGWFMVFNATFNNISVISWQSVLLVEETTAVASYLIHFIK